MFLSKGKSHIKCSINNILLFCCCFSIKAHPKNSNLAVSKEESFWNQELYSTFRRRLVKISVSALTGIIQPANIHLQKLIIDMVVNIYVYTVFIANHLMDIVKSGSGKNE